ncbi:MAG TPA: DUF2794 domain-containing protein [Rhodospirillaceae bacterium]|jgi:hypothetical protein|nr:hypothetical protein [Rhodospirillaceae bacterium]MAX62992.1 hypothetical protein [Rhodospirillaceae bacterium]MBB57839.1 hypothetical protein [Rhodospirillaceae bacterium]HBM13826.1 DUF2794 domain-containing protein [Rhodospirillaceae bacterium]|tara:strand:+ start:579 stop:920 length:342 start_codon:yes stop_codon:yes gene_type:complete
MTELIDFSEYRRRGGGKQRTYFDQGELRQLLAMYSVRVSTGEWRDYAIDFNGPVAVFSIFRHTHETPLFAVAKRRNGKHFEFIVRSGRQTLKRCRELSEALKTFDKPVRLIQS